MAEQVPEDRTHIDAIKEALADLGFLKGFPGDEKSFNGLAKAYARFIETKTIHHPKFGTVIPLDWLIIYIADHCEFMPTPVEARKLYTRYWRPRDGREITGVDD